MKDVLLLFDGFLSGKSERTDNKRNLVPQWQMHPVTTATAVFTAEDCKRKKKIEQPNKSVCEHLAYKEAVTAKK